MTLQNNHLDPNRYCVGQWCNPLLNLLGEIPHDPFKSISSCEELTHSLKPGKVLSVNLSISCSPDYLSYYRSVEGVVQILEGMFPSEYIQLWEYLSHSKVMMSFGTNPVPGFSIPLLTIRLDIFPSSELCPIEVIEEHLVNTSPFICGYLCETEVKSLRSRDEIRGFIFHRMRSEVGFRNTREFKELLTKTDLIRWSFFIEGTSPTVFYGDVLLDFRNSKVGRSLVSTDKLFETTFSNWGSI